ncbi:DUF3558 family protein [Saccharomonospora azurea]|uniref:DUF3558 family protein n=1 Tax=Saccharomonospora azurea TaxID=40988 RepID=UPI003D93685A
MSQHSSLLIAIITMAMASAACNGTSDEVAEADFSPYNAADQPSSSQPSRTDNAQLNPCSLLDAASDLSEVGTFAGPTRKDRAGARSCVWQLERDNPAGEGLVIALDVRDDQTVDSLTDVGGGVRPGAINDRTAAEAPDPASNDCTLAIELDTTSRIDVGIAAMDDVNAACEVAREVAYLVEPRLTKA